MMPNSLNRSSILRALVLVCFFGFAGYVQAQSADVATVASASKRLIYAVPWYSGGDLHGYRLNPIRDAESYAAIGLLRNDLLLEVDGLLMTEQASIQKLFERLDSGDPVVVKIKRGDRIGEVTLQLQ